MFRNRYIFGKTAQTTPGYVPEYLIAGLKLRHVVANRFNASRDVSAEDGVIWFEKSISQAEQERITSQEVPVSGICGCRMDSYQDFIVLGRRFLYLFELKNIG
jgi:hypothetical protein